MDDSKICTVYVSKISGASHANKHHILPLHTRKIILHTIYCDQVHSSCWTEATQTARSYFPQDEDKSKDTFLHSALRVAHHTGILSMLSNLYKI